MPAKDRTTRSLADLRGRKIAVRRSSSYHQALAPLQARHGFELELVPEDEETEDILDAVGEGRHAATVADSNIVDVELTYSDAIRAVGPIGDPRDIAWMLRKDQPQLKAAADRFVRRIYRSTFYNITMTKYFKNERHMRAAPARSARTRPASCPPTTPWSRSTRRCTSSTGGSSRPRCTRSRASTRGPGAGPGRWG